MTTLRTPREVAERLRCSVKTLNGHVRSGALKYISMGRGTKRQRRMFTDADIDEFIQRQTRRDVPLANDAPSRRRHRGPGASSDVIGFRALRDLLKKE